MLDYRLNQGNYPVREIIKGFCKMNQKLSRTGKYQESSSDLLMIAKSVRTVRLAHKITQTELAGLSGTGLRFISELERGKPTVELIKVLAVLSSLGLRIQIIGDTP